MYCSKCGTKNEDSASFCYSCGAPLQTIAAPAHVAPVVQPNIAAPPVAVPSSGPAYVPRQTKPYRAEYAMGLTSAIIGIVMGIFLVIMSVLEISGEFYFDGYAEVLIILATLFCIASVVLGFVGSGMINKGNLTGGVLFIIGSGLGFFAMFFSPAGVMTLFYWPLLLAAGITALARRAALIKSGDYHQ